MRSRTLAKLLLVLAGLLILTVPVARAAETLVLTCTKCTELIVTGKGLPANDRVRVGVVYVQTDANGAFNKKIPMDLGEHPTLESTVWKQDNSVLVVAAHSRFTAPCKPEDTLAFTGSHAPLLLGLGLVLLAAGGLLIRGSRRAYHPVH